MESGPFLKRNEFEKFIICCCRFYEQSDEKVGRSLLQACANTALRAGVPVQFCLLQDVLRDALPPASVYWFLNAFRLTDEQRGRLHEILARTKATAIWTYAPGYIGQTASAENVSKLVNMQVGELPGGGTAGSLFELAGKWAAKGEAFGSSEGWSPLLYIDDPKASVLARYADSKKPSAALVYCEEGWKSLFLAEPGLSPGVLRDVLELLEQHVYFRKTVPLSLDGAYFAPDLIAIHAGEAGERAVDLGQVFDIEDALNPEAGWPRTRLINIPFYPGETRILRLKPSQPTG